MDDNTPEQEKKDEEKTKSGMLSRLLGGDRIVGIVVILGIVGIALIFVSSYIGTGSKSTPEAEDSAPAESDLTIYRSELSEELGNMLASMEGVGRTKVMITLGGTVRNVYATDTDYNDRQTSRKSGGDENADKQNTEKKSCIVIRQKDGSEKALTVGQLMPEIKGVLVVCEGGDDEAVRKRVTEAVAAALDISTIHICVSKLST